MESFRLIAATYLLARHLLTVHPLPHKPSSWDCLAALDPNTPVTFRNSYNGIEIWQPRIYSEWSNPFELSDKSYEKLLQFQPVLLQVINYPIDNNDGFMSNKSGVYRLGDVETKELLPVQIRTEVIQNPEAQSLANEHSHIYEIYLDFLDGEENLLDSQLLFSHKSHNQNGTLLHYYYLRVYLRLDPLTKNLKVFLVGQDSAGFPWETPQSEELNFDFSKIERLDLEKVSR